MASHLELIPSSSIDSMSKRPHVDATPVSRPGKQRKKSTQAEPTKLVGSTSLDEAKQEIATVDPSWLDKNRLPFKDAVVGYQEEFINVKQSKEWLEELLNLGECAYLFLCALSPMYQC